MADYSIHGAAFLYYGLHGWLGYAWNFTGKASPALSAKMLRTRQQWIAWPHMRIVALGNR